MSFLQAILTCLIALASCSSQAPLHTRENLFPSNYLSKHEYNTIAITLHLSWCLLQKKTFYTLKLVCLFHLLAICLIKFNLFLQNLDSAGECHNLTKFSWIFKVVFPILYTIECSNQTKHTFLIWDCKAHLFLNDKAVGLPNHLKTLSLKNKILVLSSASLFLLLQSIERSSIFVFKFSIKNNQVKVWTKLKELVKT